MLSLCPERGRQQQNCVTEIKEEPDPGSVQEGDAMLLCPDFVRSFEVTSDKQIQARSATGREFLLLSSTFIFYYFPKQAIPE